MSSVDVEPYGILEDVEEEDESLTDHKSMASFLVKLDDTFSTEYFKIPTGPFMPKSEPDLTGLSQTAIAKILDEMSDQDIEDLVQKNTESFRCLAQALISRSSIIKHILYYFPELEDPGIDEAFNYVVPEEVHDNIGAARYKQLCKEMNIGPISRVIRSLNTETLNLKFYGLSEKQFKAISGCIMFNTYIKYLIFEDNWITPEAALWLCEMLRENDSIKTLNLRECRLGVEGMTNCIDGFSLNQSINEIDLSYNDLGNVGIQTFTEALRDNFNVDKLNLSHNNLGEPAGQVLGELLKEHNNIDYLDLGWNDLYSGKAIVYLVNGIIASDGLEYLNLSWNGLGSPESIAPLVKYIKGTQKLQHLDLSFNRITGKSVMMLSAALKENKSLNSIDLGFNLITPADATKFISFLTPKHQLQYLDLQNVYVNKDFVTIWKQLTEAGKTIRIEGVLNDYTIVEPDRRKVAFERCRYLAQKPKNKKLKKDFGSDFIWDLPDETIDNDTLMKLVKTSKIKLDQDLVEFLGEAFSVKKKKIDLKLMRETYLEMYPDTVAPVAPKKKGKRKKSQSASEPTEKLVSTVEKAIGTESAISLLSSSLVTSKRWNIPIALKSLSKLTKEYSEPDDHEEVVSTVNLETPYRRKQVTIKSIASNRAMIKAQSMKSVVQLSEANHLNALEEKDVIDEPEVEDVAEIEEETTTESLLNPNKRKSITFKDT